MKAVVCRAFGIEHAVLSETAVPPTTPNDVRLQVQAVGVSFANLLAIAGKHQNRQDPPFIPGTEVAGIVLEAGSQVTHVKPGDRVVAGIQAGGYAEQVVAPQATVFRLPDAVDVNAAVQFPTIYATAYAALKWRADLQPGETLLVHGAAGGSGLAAIDIGKQLGAQVIAVASSAEKVQAALDHGAAYGIHDKQTGFRDAVLTITNGRGADVIFDPVGGVAFDESLRCIAPQGRIIPMGFASGVIPQIPANLALVKNITVIGLYWGYYMGWARQPAPPGMQDKVREAFNEMFDWTAAGKLNPTTWRRFALADFRQALRAVASREVIGRVVLNP